MASTLSEPHFHSEEFAYQYVEARLWPDGPICPHCGSVNNARSIKANPQKRIRYGLKCCNDCCDQFTVKVGTIFEDSKVPMHVWLQAMFLLCSSKKGISTRQLHRMLGVTLKTAWFMSHRIREAMKDNGTDPMGGSGMTLEVDETFLGKQATVFRNGKGWQQRRGTGDMRKIVSLVERGGRARSIHVESLKKDEVIRALQTAHRDSVLNTDQAQHYRRLGKEFAGHSYVDHGREEYGRYENGSVITTNTVEGFFSIFKRGMRGIYQHCGEVHLHRYLSEFDFRYNHRIALGVDDVSRTDNCLKGTVGKRLTYRRIGGEEAWQTA